MKVLLVFLGRRDGGARYAKEMGAALLKRGAEVSYVLSRRNVLLAEFSRGGDFAGRVGSTALFSTPESSFQLLTRLPALLACLLHVYRFVRRERPDFVYVPMLHPWSIPVSRLARGLGVEVVLTVHDARPHLGEGGRLAEMLIEHSIRAASMVTTLTAHVMHDVRARYPRFDDRNSVVIPLGLFFMGPPARPRVLRAEPLRLLFFGRIIAYKGVQRALDTIRLLAGERRIVLELCGEGDTTAYDFTGIPPGGVIVNNQWIPEAAVGEVFLRSDICLLPYLEATQSGVLALAFAYGLPVVATPSPGLVEQLAHGGGVVAADFSAEALAAGVRSLIDDPEAYARASREAIAAREHLSWDRAAEKLLGMVSRRCGTPFCPRDPAGSPHL